MPGTAHGAAERVLVLGGGIGGLAAGWALARKGYDVEIFERNAHAGGLAATKRRDGFAYDLGPHNIHTRHAHVLEFLRRNFPKMYRHDPSARIYKRGRWIPYPLQGSQVLTALPPWKLPPAVASLLAARARMFAGEPPEDGSFESWIRNRFGGVLFREYFKTYPEKVWRLSTSEIDRIVGEKRIPVVGLVELVRSAVLGRPVRVEHPEVSEENFYLPHGIGTICDFFERGLRTQGGRIRFNARVVGVEVTGDRASAVRIETSGGEGRVPCDHLISTIPIDDFVRCFDDIPPEVREAADALDYCATVLLFLKVRRAGVLPAHFVYFTEPGVRFSRVSDMGRFSRAMMPEGRTLLCVEFPCEVDDATWRAVPDELAAHAEAVLTERAVLRPGEVEGVFDERLSHAYPRFRKGFAAPLRRCLDFVGRYRNVVTFGRQGEFAYINTDGVIHRAFRAAAAIVMGEPLGYRASEWIEAAW